MEWSPKRFWTAATVAPEGDGFAVHLDGRPVRTPAKTPLIVPTEGLAKLIASEWEAQTDAVRPDTMPATRSANAALDKVAPQREAVVNEIANYGGSDLLCYRADGPAELVGRQAAWDALLDWSRTHLDAPLDVTVGLIPIQQPDASIARLRAHVSNLSSFELAALHDLVAISGSLILGLAVANQRLKGAEAFEISRIDEAFQAETWGVDEESSIVDARRRASFLSAEAFFLLCR
ncbi:ATP12 family chaperone protein [Falsirhodobacter sp. alg1]|uniref:ATP12 family chaperone protein n=1 Tax=Falsirhodobacter sp. alg1 TaxID=1472418 RepID=UPI0005EE1464|nr:ATP12 family protein [Falsirhodobacter sp. alg1]